MSAPARKKRANIEKQVFIHKGPLLTSQVSIENLPDFVNPPSTLKVLRARAPWEGALMENSFISR